ncbi:hypothetical protein LRS03_00170 [Rhizobacter sp. J219]|nr:hypothetical protein [Rhizobacter sp. J219]MCR5881362.1 hypothetical protein [Rhizobacter sp. J219]
MSRLVKGTVACGALVAGHCGLMLLAAAFNAAWIAMVPLLAICRSVVG